MAPDNNQNRQQTADPSGSSRLPFAAPSISLPKGGGAIRGIGEKFATNPVTGTGSMTVPIATSPGRSGFGPQLALSYDSGSGNGPFGLGWTLGLPSITRKTDKGLPRYLDGEDSDVFMLSGAEDLVPVLVENAPGQWEREQLPLRIVNGAEYKVDRYRPRIEGLFSRIERWRNIVDRADCFWRSISRDNVTTWYGRTAQSRIADPADSAHIFSWLICQSYDDKGNDIVYEYVGEDSAGVDFAEANERNRSRTANRYLKRIKYGNRKPNRDADWIATDPSVLTDWMFELLFDFDEGHYQAFLPNTEQQEFVAARLEPTAAWAIRDDCFSSYRSGFEVRTCRLCRRVLMFHHFPEELGREDYLVRSTEFSYDESRIASFITKVTQSGYLHMPADGEPDRYLRKSLPALQFEYSQVPTAEQLAEQPIHDVDAASVENLPYGPDGGVYQWVDLDGEGASGILSEQADGWFYKRNLSANNQVDENKVIRTAARLGPVELVASRPSTDLAGGQAQFMDLAGDGQVDLVVKEGGLQGFYERTQEGDWVSFRPFTSWPNLDTRDPNLRFIDLDADGHTDVLITEHDVLTWYPSLAEAGFAPSQRVQTPHDEEEGPRLVFADGTDSIYVADLSGDGLLDLVRIRNGEVCYWPNLGYGRFGKKVTMDHAPWFESTELFDQKRLRLADIDGSGTTDIIYLRANQIDIYRNQAGNSWTASHALTGFPRTDNLSSVQAVDLLGNGTACLVWSSALPGEAARPMRYIDLMGGRKPHLLIKTINNLGAETVVHYAPSTKFYLDDKLAGTPWVTRLPFPVHVVERVETYDRVSGNRFVTRSEYHHGYFDGDEREFRGFGMIEQWDTEELEIAADQTTSFGTNLDKASFVPPIRTKTWFHTGVYLGRDQVSRHFASEYYREPDWDDLDASKSLLDDTPLPVQLTSDEEREACRALKGMMLRQEIYADDAPGEASEEIIKRANTPYSVTEQNFTVRLLQPHGGNRHAAFFAHAGEVLSRHYERNPKDPRISHTLTLEVDTYGNVLKSAAVGYGRDKSDLAEEWDQQQQTRTLVTYTENRLTNAVDKSDAYATPRPAEARTFQLTGYPPTDPSGRFQMSDFVALDSTTHKQVHVFDSELRYEAPPSNGRQRRSIEHVRTVYRRHDLSGLLPLGDLGELEPLGLPGESYKLAFTPGLLADTYRRQLGDAPEEPLLPEPAAVLGGSGADRGGYRSSQDLRNEHVFPPNVGHPLWTESDKEDHWWIPSGQVFADKDDNAGTALTFAHSHFFLPHRFRDPFGHSVTVAYDGDETHAAKNHNLLVVETRDPLTNLVRAGHDYRVLLPNLMIDPNGNQSAARFDALGMVVGTAVSGKANEGDSFERFVADLTLAQTTGYFDSTDPRPLAISHLGTATTRMIYDFDRVPGCAASIARETHVSDLKDGEQTKVQLTFVYSDGFGREAQTKVQAEPGPLDPDDDASPHLERRWVGTGAKVYNNKGKPIRQYEPFFSPTHAYGIEQHGVSSTLFYDPPERVVATLHPNHTWEKVVFDAWQQAAYDVSDTVLSVTGSTDPKLDPDVGGFFSRLLATEYLPTWYEQRITEPTTDPERVAADKTAVHRQTPTIALFDTLGRTFLTIAQNRFTRNGLALEQSYPTRVELDIEGNQRQVRDAKTQNGDPLGRIVVRYDYDMLGNRIHQASMEAGERWMLNDVTAKLIRTWDSRGFTRRMTYDELRRPTGLFVEDGAERLAERTVYGESQGAANNHRTRISQIFDAAGIVTNEAYDFKGNLRRSQRELLPDYKGDVDWQQNPTPNDGTFVSSTTFDALNRPIAVTSPDNSTYLPTYNEANLLDKVEVNLRGTTNASNEPVWTPFVNNIDYNAKGQRTLIRYANGAETTYNYDQETFRLLHLKTTRTPSPNGLASHIFKDLATVQDFHYTYDASANITRIEDSALLTTFNNGEVKPVCEYTYDAFYRLIEATGREQIGQTVFDFHATEGNRRDYPFVSVNAHPNDLQAIRHYTERYEYDSVGNFDIVRHIANGGSWTRFYEYDAASLIHADHKSNRLTKTTVGNGENFVESYTYIDALGRDVHGCMTAINAIKMGWDFEDQLQKVDLGGGGTAYYVYDAGGQRVRKVIDTQGSTRTEERVYVGGFEVFREYNGNGTAITLQRDTLHVMDDKQRIALVETKTAENASPIDVPAPAQRYQLGNHLGSASLELDKDGRLISYEEYHPYGTAAFQAMDSAAEVSLKRYRFTGKERDEETGLYYHGARYYAVWFGRWTSCDPIGLPGGINAFAYADNEPVAYADPSGSDPEKPEAPPPLRPPEAGKHPEAVLAESEFNSAWEAALERRYKGGSSAKNQEVFLERLGKASDKEAFGAKEYANTYKVFRDIVKNDPKLSQYDWSDVELHHMAAKKQGPVAEPELAVNPNNLLLTRGKAKVRGTSHNQAQVGPGEMRRQRAELARRAAAKSAVGPTRPAPPPQPTEVIGPPAPEQVAPAPEPIAAPKPITPASPPPKAAPAAPAPPGVALRLLTRVGSTLGGVLTIVQIKQTAEEIRFIFEGDPSAPIGTVKHTITYGSVKHIGGNRWVSLNMPES
jgi:RHS repeat-associated protein